MNLKLDLWDLRLFSAHCSNGERPRWPIKVDVIDSRVRVLSSKSLTNFLKVSQQGCGGIQTNKQSLLSNHLATLPPPIMSEARDH